eukprot:m51a1_g6332 hypothetical protein (598) ;mRNA; r:14406-16740
MPWTRPSATGQGPCPRCAHTTNSFPDKAVVFGGWSGSRMVNDVYVLNLSSMRWAKQARPRGGDGTNYLNDLHVLDTDTMSWQQGYTTGPTPCSRSRHTANLVGANIIFFAGGDNSRVYNDVYILDTEKMLWLRPNTVGTPPSPRWGHTAVTVGERIVVFGGHDGATMLNDAYVLDTATFTWSQLPIVKNEGEDSTPPTPRAGHTMTTLSATRLLLFGGGDGEKVLNDLHVLEKTASGQWRWHHLPTSPTAPTGRCAHTAVIVGADTDASAVIVFGGGDGNRRFKDVYILDVARALKELLTRPSKQAATSAPQPAAAAPSSQEKQQAPPVCAAASACPQQPAQQQQQQQQQGQQGQLPQGVAAAQAQGAAGQAKAPLSIRVRDPVHNTDIGALLHTLGLDGYAPAFIAEDITPETLPLLTERHLEQLGVATIGARLKILNAARRLEKQQAQQPHSAVDDQLRAAQLLQEQVRTSQALATRLEHAAASLAASITAAARLLEHVELRAAAGCAHGGVELQPSLSPVLATLGAAGASIGTPPQSPKQAMSSPRGGGGVLVGLNGGSGGSPTPPPLTSVPQQMQQQQQGHRQRSSSLLNKKD